MTEALLVVTRTGLATVVFDCLCVAAPHLNSPTSLATAQGYLDSVARDRQAAAAANPALRHLGAATPKPCPDFLGRSST